MSFLPYFSDGFDVLGLTRLLNKEGVVRSNAIGNGNGMRYRKPTMKLNQQIYVRTYSVAHGLDYLLRMGLMFARNERPPWTRQRIELQCRVPLFYGRFRSTSEVIGRKYFIAPAVGVYPNFLTALSTDKIVNRLPAGLSHDVPHSGLKAGHCAIELQRTAPLSIIVIGPLRKILDIKRITTNEVFSDLLHMSIHRRIAVVLRVDFSPPTDTFIRFYFDEDEVLTPTRMDRERLHGSNLHDALPWSKDGWGDRRRNPRRPGIVTRYTAGTCLYRHA